MEITGSIQFLFSDTFCISWFGWPKSYRRTISNSYCNITPDRSHLTNQIILNRRKWKLCLYAFSEQSCAVKIYVRVPHWIRIEDKQFDKGKWPFAGTPRKTQQRQCLVSSRKKSVSLCCIEVI